MPTDRRRSSTKRNDRHDKRNRKPLGKGKNNRKRNINKHGKGKGKDIKKSIEIAKEKKAARLEAQMLARLKDTSKDRDLIKNKTKIITAQSETNKKRKKDSGSNKMSIPTNSKDYGGSLNIPEKVEQRKYETTGQFFARLNRMVAKAKVEANMGARFDINL